VTVIHEVLDLVTIQKPTHPTLVTKPELYCSSSQILEQSNQNFGY